MDLKEAWVAAMVVEDEAEAEASSRDWRQVLMVCVEFARLRGTVAWSGRRVLGRRMGQRCFSS